MEDSCIWVWLCSIVVFVVTMLIIYSSSCFSTKLNSVKNEIIDEPKFVITKVEKHNELIAKYIVENNFSKGTGEGYTYNKFVFFDTRGKYNVGDILILSKNN